MRRACSPFEAWGAWPRSRFAALTSNCLKDNQTNAIVRKKLLRLVSARFLCVRTKRIFYLLSFPDVLNANGSRSYYSPLKAGSPAPLHNPLSRVAQRSYQRRFATSGTRGRATWHFQALLAHYRG